MTKTDATIGATIGLLIGVFFFIVLKTLQIEIPGAWLLLFIFPLLALLGLFVASIIGRKILTIYQLAKFLLVGALNTFVDLGILNFLMWVSGIYTGIFYSVFKAISFLLATVNSYLWNRHWTFGKKNGIFIQREYLKFLIIVTVGFLINVGTASLLVNVVGPQFGISDKMWANIGAFAAIFIAWVWNFSGAKFVVFKK